ARDDPVALHVIGNDHRTVIVEFAKDADAFLYRASQLSELTLRNGNTPLNFARLNVGITIAMETAHVDVSLHHAIDDTETSEIAPLSGDGNISIDRSAQQGVSTFGDV